MKSVFTFLGVLSKTVPHVLFMDEKERKFYVGIEEYLDDDLTEWRPGKLQGVTIAEALNWYHTLAEHHDNTEGDLGPLCREAAKLIYALQRGGGR